MQARSARLACKLALGPHVARTRVFCETDGAPSTNGPTVDQPLVAAITIFLLEKRGEVLTPRSLPRTQSWRLDLEFCRFKEKNSRFFFFCTTRQWHKEQQNTKGYKSLFRHWKPGLSPQFCRYMSTRTHPSLSPKDELSLSERHRF